MHKVVVISFLQFIDCPSGLSDCFCNSGKPRISCPVCGDTAVPHFHYGGMCCYSCKAFFRRVVNTYKVDTMGLSVNTYKVDTMGLSVNTYKV